MTTFIQTCLLWALLPLAFSLLIDICLGYPAKEESPDTRAIFFGYSLWLAEWRLKRLGLFRSLYLNFKENLNSGDRFTRITARKAYRQVLFTTAREYFTWELGFGMCPVCTNVRISILFALLCIHKYGLPLGSVVAIPCFSSLYLLIFNKLKN